MSILTYTTSDLGNAFIKTTGTEVMLRDLGVNVDNSQDAIQDLEFAKKIALQNNTTGLPMSALISMISLKSPNAKSFFALAKNQLLPLS